MKYALGVLGVVLGVLASCDRANQERVSETTVEVRDAAGRKVVSVPRELQSAVATAEELPDYNELEPDERKLIFGLLEQLPIRLNPYEARLLIDLCAVDVDAAGGVSGESLDVEAAVKLLGQYRVQSSFEFASWERWCVSTEPTRGERMFGELYLHRRSFSDVAALHTFWTPLQQDIKRGLTAAAQKGEITKEAVEKIEGDAGRFGLALKAGDFSGMRSVGFHANLYPWAERGIHDRFASSEVSVDEVNERSRQLYEFDAALSRHLGTSEHVDSTPVGDPRPSIGK